MSDVETLRQPSPPAANAVLHAPEAAFKRGLPDVPAHLFARERNLALAPGRPSGLIALDLSAELGLAGPATTPAMLARYVLVRAGEHVAHEFSATGEVHYVIRGQGETESHDVRIVWKAGDVFVLPGAANTCHRASSDSILLCVTDEPLLAMLCVPAPDAAANRAVKPAHFSAASIDAQLDLIHRRTGPQKSAGKAVNFFTSASARVVSLLPAMSAGMNTLEPGGNQRPHRHNAAALTLGIQVEGVHSMVGGQRFDWIAAGVMVTPPLAVHSHHNRGPAMMKSLVLQDGGLYYNLRCPGFSWED